MKKKNTSRAYKPLTLPKTHQLMYNGAMCTMVTRVEDGFEKLIQIICGSEIIWQIRL